MTTEFFLRVTVQAFSLIFGSCGMFFLWASFYNPPLASYTIIFLSAATAITIATTKTTATTKTKR
jgi:hypothetical protein